MKSRKRARTGGEKMGQMTKEERRMAQAKKEKEERERALAYLKKKGISLGVQKKTRMKVGKSRAPPGGDSKDVARQDEQGKGSAGGEKQVAQPHFFEIQSMQRVAKPLKQQGVAVPAPAPALTLESTAGFGVPLDEAYTRSVALPQHWKIVRGARGILYFWNIATNTTSWADPRMLHIAENQGSGSGEGTSATALAAVASAPPPPPPPPRLPPLAVKGS